MSEQGSIGSVCATRSRRRRKKGKKSVQRKGLVLADMPSSWANDVGPNLSFPVEAGILSSEEETDTGPDSEAGHVTEGDDDWNDGSDQIFACVAKIGASIEAEASAHRMRPDRTRWSVNERSTAAGPSGGGFATGLAGRSFRRLMTALRRDNVAQEPDDASVPLMPAFKPKPGEKPDHREKNRSQSLFPFPACVARPVGKAEINREPLARAALQKEWDRLKERKVWDVDPKAVREWRDVAAEARANKEEAHMGMLFEICVEKGSELAPELRKYKGRVVFQGNQVKN